MTLKSAPIIALDADYFLPYFRGIPSEIHAALVLREPIGSLMVAKNWISLIHNILILQTSHRGGLIDAGLLVKRFLKKVTLHEHTVNFEWNIGVRYP